jgi:nitroreductase
MSRAFSQEAIAPSLFEECVDLAARAPSAGKSQGWSLLVLTEDETSQYWDIALPPEKRKGFAFPSLLNAPLVALVLADPHAYLSRYSEADKASTGLGESVDQWPAPYWTIDASFATMTLLLALEDKGVSSLFFAHAQEETLREFFGIPTHVQILGTIACGYALSDNERKGRSASRTRLAASSVIHRSRW